MQEENQIGFLKASTVDRIYVDSNRIIRNRKSGTEDPTIVIERTDGGDTIFSKRVWCRGPVDFISHPRAETGPTVWAETDEDVHYEL